ncbi:MAG: DinB family protein [Streptosporangiaceae bacterium]|nr:DinB family protein [Streptosporangiaceae bacterium]
MPEQFFSPTIPASSRTEVFLRYLDYFRSRLAEKLEALPTEELRRSRLPSGWTPLELLKHLRYVETRWLEWGFAGRDVGDPWGDSRDGRWHLGQGESLGGLLAELRAQAGRSRAIIESHDLSEPGEPGERWDGAEPATLERILFHLVQEYARHLGHLDIVAELATGLSGE